MPESGWHIRNQTRRTCEPHRCQPAGHNAPYTSLSPAGPRQPHAPGSRFLSVVALLPLYSELTSNLYRARDSTADMAHILVIEDEHELARLIASALSDDGHTTEVIRDGQFALDRINDPNGKEPDLFILDLMLPRVDGLTICRRIRQTRVTPIIMLT